MQLCTTLQPFSCRDCVLLLLGMTIIGRKAAHPLHVQQEQILKQQWVVRAWPCLPPFVYLSASLDLIP
jgi:hypothetical protein